MFFIATTGGTFVFYFLKPAGLNQVHLYMMSLNNIQHFLYLIFVAQLIVIHLRLLEELGDLLSYVCPRIINIIEEILIGRPPSA